MKVLATLEQSLSITYRLHSTLD